MSITRKQKKQLLETIGIVSTKVLGYQVLPYQNDKFVKANLQGNIYKDSKPKTLTLIGAEIVEEAKEVFYDVPKEDSNYKTYVPIIDKLETALNGDYDILKDLAA